MAIERCPRSDKAIDSSWQGHTALGGASPDVAREFDGVRVVIAPARDRADIWPALKGKANRRSTRWTKVNEDFLAATVRSMLVSPKFALIELDCVQREDGFGVERCTGHALAERAMTGKRT